MAGPWEKYKQAPGAPQEPAGEGPWSRYANPPEPQEAPLRGSMAPTEPTKGQNPIMGALDAATRGLTFGFGDELTAHEAALLGRTPEGGFFQYDTPYQERYQRALEAERTQNEAFRDQAPVTSFASEAGGALLNPVTKLAAPVKGASMAANAARAGKVGAAEGAVYGAGAADGDIGDRIEGAALGGALGGTVAGASPFVGKQLTEAFAKNPLSPVRKLSRQLMKEAPETDELFKQGKKFYDDASASGVVVKSEAGQRFADSLEMT